MDKESIKMKFQVMAAVSAMITWTCLGTIIFHILEKWTWVQSFYFSVVTITTVGYGNLHPTTDISMFITALYILSGVTIAVTSLGIIGADILKIREGYTIKKQEKNNK